MESAVRSKAEHGHLDHGHHEMPTEGAALTAVAVSATLHCLTGCAIGEVAGMAIGTGLGFSNLGTIALAVALAFLFGYALTSLPLLRAGLALGVVIPIALASDTLSIATMEIVDNLVLLLVPGAMHAGLGDVFFWGALAFALAIAFVVAVPVNRYLIARGKGHAVVHETGIHGGPPVRLVGIATAVAFVFGSAVLIAEAVSGEDGGHDGGHRAAARAPAHHEAPGNGGLEIALERDKLPRSRPAELAFTIHGPEGEPISDFDLEHARRMHLIVIRRDLTGFQHLHPRMDASGRWTAPIEVPASGPYRAFADFSHGGESATLGTDLTVAGDFDRRPLPEPRPTAEAGDGYVVTLDSEPPRAGQPVELTFPVRRAGKPVAVEPYLGANGHLVALREGDLAFLHTHPEGDHEHGRAQARADRIRFATEYPRPGRYRLFLQFRDGGAVRTAAFTTEVAR
jgi:hypothetical protein